MVSQLAQFNFQIYFRSGKPNANEDVLSHIGFKADMAETVFEKVTNSSMLSEIAPKISDELCTVNKSSAEVISTPTLPEYSASELRLKQQQKVFCAGFGTGKKKEANLQWGKQDQILVLSKNVKKLQQIKTVWWHTVLCQESPRSRKPSLIHCSRMYEVFDSDISAWSFWSPGNRTNIGSVAKAVFLGRHAGPCEKWVSSCERCLVAKAPVPSIRPPIKNLIAENPLKIVAMDFTLLEKSSDGKEIVFILSHVFTKFTVAVPTKDQKAVTVAKILVIEWFHKFGIPNCLHSKQGRMFFNTEIWALCSLYGIQKNCTIPYHPERNCQVEWFNWTMHNLFWCLLPDQKRQWPTH